MGDPPGPASPLTIMDLPEEIIEYILSLLSPYRDFKSAMLTCKLWRKITLGVIQQEYGSFQRAVQDVSLTWGWLAPESGPTVTDRYSHSACVHGKSMYIFGGCTSTSTTFNDLWRFDLGTRQWIRPLAMGTYPSPKACASLVSYKESLILFGGWSHPTPYPLHQAARFFRQLHVYTPISNRWSQVMVESSPPGTAGHAASVIRDLMVVFGGSHGHGVSCNDVWVLDLKVMEWHKREFAGNKPLPRYGHSQVVLDNTHILLIGGCGGPNMQFSDIWLLTAGVDPEPWTWTEVKVNNMEYSAPQLWCHPACKVGNRVVVLSKAMKSSKPPSPTPFQQPPVKPTKLWVPPREDLPPRSRPHNPAPCQDDDDDEDNDTNVEQVQRVFRMKRCWPDTSESSSQESSSDTEEGAASNFSPKSPGNERLHPNSGMAGSSGASTAPMRAGMPSVRPNAMKNRQKQLETLRRYEEKFRAMSTAKSSAARAGASSCQDTKRNRKDSQVPVAQNPMQVYVLDISEVISHRSATWQAGKQHVAPGAPEETIFYSLVEGWGELVMFGGIQADLNSMQREVNVKNQVVSNNVYFLSAHKKLR